VGTEFCFVGHPGNETCTVEAHGWGAAAEVETWGSGGPARRCIAHPWGSRSVGKRWSDQLGPGQTAVADESPLRSISVWTSRFAQEVGRKQKTALWTCFGWVQFPKLTESAGDRDAILVVPGAAQFYSVKVGSPTRVPQPKSAIPLVFVVRHLTLASDIFRSSTFAGSRLIGEALADAQAFAAAEYVERYRR
jgi:hypothetical protein